MESMIERVAKEMAKEYRRRPVSLAHNPDVAGAMFHMARAAIKAMRDPTEAMLDEGPPEPYMDNHVWARMIDAALKDV